MQSDQRLYRDRGSTKAFGPSLLRRAALLLSCVIGFAYKPQPQAYVLAVLVADAKAGFPLADADVTIPSRRLSLRADSSGEVHFSGLEAGYVRVTARRIGYAPTTENVLIGLADTAIAVFLMQTTAALDTVRVTGSRLPAYLAEFEARKRMGYGHFLGPEQLDSAKAERLGDFVASRFGGIRARWAGLSVAFISTRGTTSLKQSVCSVPVYIDGYFRQPDDVGSLLASDVAAVEYYSNSIPVQYQRPGASCGVILIWTKR